MTNYRLRFLFHTGIALLSIGSILLWLLLMLIGSRRAPNTLAPSSSARSPLNLALPAYSLLPSSPAAPVPPAPAAPSTFWREAAPDEIWIVEAEMGVKPTSESSDPGIGLARLKGEEPVIVGNPNNQIRYVIAPNGLDENGNPTAGWPITHSAEINQFLDLMFPILYELYGPPAIDYSVTVIRDVRRTGSAIFYPSTDEIHLGDTATYQLMTHELIHAWRNDRILSSDATWNYVPTLSGFEEAFAQGLSYKAMTLFAQRHPQFPLSQQLYQSSTEWDYDYQNVPALATTDFWTQLGGNQLHWIRYEMAAAAIAKIEQEHPGFYRAFNAEYYRRLNNDANLRPSRDLIKAIIATVAPTIEGKPASLWIDQQAIFDCAIHPGHKVWLYTQHYPFDEYFIFQRAHFYETFADGSDWAQYDGSQWQYYHLNGSVGQSTLRTYQGEIIDQKTLLISPTVNPPTWYGYGGAEINLTTQSSHLPWPGGDSNSFVTNLTNFGLYNLEVKFSDNGSTAVINMPRVMGTPLKNTRGIGGAILGGNGGQITLNHRQYGAELALPVTNGAFWGTRNWASRPEEDLLNSTPGVIDVSYVDALGNVYTDVRTIQYGSVNGNQLFLFDVAKMHPLMLVPTPTVLPTVLPTALPTEDPTVTPVPTETVEPFPTVPITPTTLSLPDIPTPTPGGGTLVLPSPQLYLPLVIKS